MIIGTVLFVLLGASIAVTAAAQGPERAATLPFVSPDGKHVVYVRDLPDKSAELVVIDADGGNAHVVARDPGGSILGFWTARGRDVSYITDRDDTTWLWRVPVAGGTPVLVTRRVAKALRPSNDGKRAAYSVGAWTRSRLTVSALDGRGAHALTDSSASWFNMAWSPDDKRIAVTRLDATQSLAVWMLDADGKNARAVTSFPDTVGRAQWPTWSPDGKSIVFQSTASGRFEVWRMNVDGSAPRQLTH